MHDDDAEKLPSGGLSTRFAELVLKAGGPTKVARELGASRTTVDKWVGGVSRIPLEAAAKVATMAGRSLDWLAGIEPAGVAPDQRPGRGVIAASGEAQISGNMRGFVDGPVPLPPGGMDEVRLRAQKYGGTALSNPDISFPEGFVAVPMLQVSASAGRARVATPEELVGTDMVAFRETWLRSLGLTPGRIHILWAVGDSMVPTISDGDMLLIDRMIDQVLDDGIYVVVVGGGVVVKRIQLRHNGSVVLKSDNERYDDQTIPADEVPSLIVEGRVRWVGGPI